MGFLQLLALLSFNLLRINVFRFVVTANMRFNSYPANTLYTADTPHPHWTSRKGVTKNSIVLQLGPEVGKVMV